MAGKRGSQRKRERGVGEESRERMENGVLFYVPCLAGVLGTTVELVCMAYNYNKGFFQDQKI